MNNQKGLVLIPLIIILVLAGAAGYFVWQKKVNDQTADWKTYRNEEFGFELKLSPKWDKVKVIRESDFYDGPNIGLFFYLPTANSSFPSKVKGYAQMFFVGVFDPKEWDSIQEEGTNEPLLIKRGSKYVFGYGLPQDLPEELDDEYVEVDKIISTFKLVK